MNDEILITKNISIKYQHWGSRDDTLSTCITMLANHVECRQNKIKFRHHNTIPSSFYREQKM